MNYTISSSVSCLLASQKILKFRISVGSSEVLVRPSNLHPGLRVTGSYIYLYGFGVVPITKPESRCAATITKPESRYAAPITKPKSSCATISKLKAGALVIDLSAFIQIKRLLQ